MTQELTARYLAARNKLIAGRIDRAEKVYFGDEPLYIWAVIRVIVKEDEQ